jgi:hypothetical protein
MEFFSLSLSFFQKRVKQIWNTVSYEYRAHFILSLFIYRQSFELNYILNDNYFCADNFVFMKFMKKSTNRPKIFGQFYVIFPPTDANTKIKTDKEIYNFVYVGFRV